jgi:hypothetical protein
MPDPELDPNVKDIEDRLRSMLGAQVRIRPKGKGGKIEVSYANWMELDQIYWRLMGGDRPKDRPVEGV